MTRTTNIRTVASIILPFSGEIIGDNNDNLRFPMLISFHNLIQLKDGQAQPGLKQSVVQTKK